MKYELIKSSKQDIDRLIEYKKATIFDHAKNLSNEEIDKINNYVTSEVPKSIYDYCNIIVDNKIAGCLLTTNKDDGKLLDEIYLEEEYRNNKIVGCLLLTEVDDGKLLDEIYLEEEYRNKGIGTNIIKNVISNNNIVYLWVYKNNIKAVELYKRLGFTIIDETETRYYMKHINK